MLCHFVVCVEEDLTLNSHTYRQCVCFLQRANVSSTHMSEGRGSLTFRLLNMRAEVIIGFFRSGKIHAYPVSSCTYLNQIP